jgi:hypothetical protein
MSYADASDVMYHKEKADLSRRQFIGCAAAAGAAVAMAPGAMLAADPQPVVAQTIKTHGRDWSKIRGFNYQPSFGSSGFEIWQKFDLKTVETELQHGKKYFPHINAIRLWLSWDSFNRDNKRFLANFEGALAIADKLGLAVMPALFNRWRDQVLDYGGIYIEHFLSGSGWIYSPNLFDAFMKAVVGGHKDDPRILAWDLCNEPFPSDTFPNIVQAEFAWLKKLYDQCKQLGVKAPITVGIHPGTTLKFIDSLCDVFSIHPYWRHDVNQNKAEFEKKLDDEVAYANKVKKPILATEACWGSLDDAVRVDSIRYSLTQLKKRNMGWLVYLLNHSLAADCHRPEFGHVGVPGYLGFIEADGSLRPGHEVFNEFQ